MSFPNVADELLKQREQLQPLLAISPSAIVLTDLDSNVVAWNPAAEELFGYTAEEATGRNLDDLVAKTEELHQAAVAFSERARGKEEIRTVTRRTRKDGTLVDVEVRAAPLLANGTAVGTFGIYHDVTELHRQRRFYEALLDVSPAAIVAIDPQDNVTLWNPAAERLFGYSAEEAIGQNVDDLVANNEEIRAEAERLNRTAEGGQIRMIGRRTRKDGSLVDVELLGAPVMVGGELVGRYAIYLDISELQRREQYYEALLEVSPEAIVTTTADDIITSWNPAAERLFGYTADEAIGTDIDDLVTRGEAQRTKGKELSFSAMRGGTEHRVTQRTRKDGSLVDVDIVGGLVTVGDELVGKHVFYHDISEIQEQKRYYEALLEVSPTAIVTVDRAGNVTSWNPAAERTFGYTADEAMGHDIDDLVAGSDEIREEAIRLSREGRSTRTMTGAITRRTRKDGSLVDVEVAGVPVFVAGEWVGDVIIYHDIGEIQRQKQFYQSILELSPTAIITVDEEFNVTSWNPGAERLFGYTAQEAMGRFIDDLVANAPELREEAAANNEAGYRGELVRAIARRTRKDGSLVDVEVVAAPVFVGGERVGHSVIYHDITEIQRQKQYYEGLLETSPIAIMTVDLNATVTSWNPAAEQMLGYSAEEAIGRNIDELVANNDEIRNEAIGVSERAREGGQVHLVTRRTRKDGSLIDVDVVAAPIFIGGEIVGYYAMYTDISELQSQKQYFEALVEVSPVAVVLVDTDNNVTSWNPAAQRLFGYSAEEAIGRYLPDLVGQHPAVKEDTEHYSRKVRAGEPTHAITRRSRKDVSLVDVELFAAPVIVSEQRVGHYVLYHDIGELQRARLEAEAATRAKSAFLATMSHEIRTPLNAVIGMTGLLLDTRLSPEQRGYGEVIRASGDALLDVINEILDFSKIEAGRLDLERQPFRLRQCVESALELVATAAADKSLDLAYLIDPRTPASIVGDFTRLRQILLNLLNNAVKFTEKGEVVLRVDAEPVSTGGDAQRKFEVHFAVRDTGIGIPEDRMDALFEAFTQVDASTTRRYGGTGLGLAISKRLAEEMGGRMWATSRVGQGSTFHVTIEAEAVEGPTAAEELETIPELGGKRLLIVDDNATNREILRRQAESWGMVPVEAVSPTEALDHVARGERFDLAILDMQMPEMDGVTLAEEIRRHPTGQGLPLVMLTSLGRRESSPSAAEFAAFLTKPIRPSQLYDALIGIFAPEAALQRVARPEPRPVPTPQEAPPLRILLAEDNAVNQRVALLLLEKLGYRADVAADGLEAIRALERQAYDVVLMDVQMPEMDGLEATREIARRWPRPDRPRIIAMTAGATEADREACLAAGMDDYVSKPIRQEELTAALARSVQVGTLSDGEVRDGSTLDMEALNRLRETVGGEDALNEVMTTFFQDTERILVELRADVEAGRAAEVRRHAHSLKSTAASFGAAHLSELCRTLEELGQTGRLEGAAPLVEEIAAEFAFVRNALRP